MKIFTPIIEIKEKEILPIPKYDGVKMSLEEFQNFEFEDPGYKYEWNNGITEAEILMKDTERFLIDNIIRKFILTNSFQNGNSILPEADVFLESLNKFRRPDACYFEKQQIRQPKVFSSVPLFIIEIISPSNSSVEVENKIKEYFLAGSKVVWHIYPSMKEVRIYYSPKQVRICTDGDICDAGNIIVDFSISVNELFGV